MAKAQREWAEALAAQQPLAREEVDAFVGSVASSSGSAVADGGATGSLAAAATSLEAVVPLALFLSRSLGKVSSAGGKTPARAALKLPLWHLATPSRHSVWPFLTTALPTCLLLQFPDAVVPRIVAALGTVVSSAEALSADATSAAAANAAASTPSAPGALPPLKWAALLSQAMAELGAVLALLPLHAQWKAQLSGAFCALLEQLLAPAARRLDQHSAMLAGFRTALTAGRERLPLTSSDAAQVGLA